MRIRLPFLMAVTLGALGVFYGTSTQGLNASTTTSITTLENRQFDLAGSAGTKLVSFYSPDCPISKRNTANLSALHQQFNHHKVDVIAVAMPYDGIDAIKQFNQENDVDYHVAHDTNGTIADAFPDVRFTPTTFLIDETGTIVWRHTGKMRTEDVSEALAGTLGKRSASAD